MVILREISGLDSSVSCEILDKMVTATSEVDWMEDPHKCVKLCDISFAELENKSFADFVTKIPNHSFHKAQIASGVPIVVSIT